MTTDTATTNHTYYTHVQRTTDDPTTSRRGMYFTPADAFSALATVTLAKGEMIGVEERVVETVRTVTTRMVAPSEAETAEPTEPEPEAVVTDETETVEDEDDETYPALTGEAVDEWTEYDAPEGVEPEVDDEPQI